MASVALTADRVAAATGSLTALVTIRATGSTAFAAATGSLPSCFPPLPAWV